jgi:antitoxin component YwqK of YwqJK toxin-antitoxin module
MEIEIVREYYSNGQLKFERGLLNGLWHGMNTEYRSNGEFWYSCHCKNGRYFGIYKQFHYMVKGLCLIKQFKNGQHGTQVEFIYGN